MLKGSQSNAGPYQVGHLLCATSWAAHRMLHASTSTTGALQNATRNMLSHLVKYPTGPTMNYITITITSIPSSSAQWNTCWKNTSSLWVPNHISHAHRTVAVGCIALSGEAAAVVLPPQHHTGCVMHASTSKSTGCSTAEQRPEITTSCMQQPAQVPYRPHNRSQDWNTC